jgi:hypothetical protein
VRGHLLIYNYCFFICIAFTVTPSFFSLRNATAKSEVSYSESFRKLREVASRNYKTLIPCLRNSVYLDLKEQGLDRNHCDPVSLLEFPDDAEAHYQELLLKTKPLR